MGYSPETLTQSQCYGEAGGGTDWICKENSVWADVWAKKVLQTFSDMLDLAYVQYHLQNGNHDLIPGELHQVQHFPE